MSEKDKLFRALRHLIYFGMGTFIVIYIISVVAGLSMVVSY